MPSVLLESSLGGHGPTDCSDLFDWDKYLTPSEGSSSDGGSVTTGLTTLTAAGTSVAFGTDRDLDPATYLLANAPSGDVSLLKDALWPQVPVTQPPRAPTINIQTAPRGTGSPEPLYPTSQMPHSNHGSPIGSPSRTLMNPEQTAEIRKRKACHPCRIAKVACDLNAVCQRCEDLCKKLGSDSATDVCIRKEPSKVIGTQFNRWAWVDWQFPKPDQFEKRPTNIYLSFSMSGVQCPCLRVCVDASSAQRANGTIKTVGIAPDHKAHLREDIWAWAEAQLLWERAGTFEWRIERLLRDFVRGNILDEVSKTKDLREKQAVQLREQKALMLNVLRMSGAWRVWGAERLFVRPGPDSERAFAPSLGLEPVLNQLKGCAESILKQNEKDVLDGIDSYLAPRDIREKDHPDLWAAMNVAMWLTLTQLILLYRKTMGVGLASRQEYPGIFATVGASTRRNEFFETTAELLRSLVVIYSSHFRTRNVLESLKKAALPVFASDEEVHRDFEETWERRQQFYQAIKDQFLPSGRADKLIIDHIISKEEKVLGRKQTSPKRSKDLNR
ncbi:hypothetical protein GQ53DRAFT_752134 [Thozetella sp. PMI_491]|nr:hypothetical protein GQ53DRAFT_752134 [Thozetella sp. PMI_491]